MPRLFLESWEGCIVFFGEDRVNVMYVIYWSKIKSDYLKELMQNLDVEKFNLKKQDYVEAK